MLKEIPRHHAIWLTEGWPGGPVEGNRYELLEDEQFVDSHRWYNVVMTVFLYHEDGKIYAFAWHRGLTENQDDMLENDNMYCGNYQDDGRTVQVFEVEPKEVTITKYERI